MFRLAKRNAEKQRRRCSFPVRAERERNFAIDSFAVIQLAVSMFWEETPMTIFEQILQSITDETARLKALVSSEQLECDADELREKIQTQCHCRDFVEHAFQCKMNAAEVSAAAAEAAERGRISDSHPELNAEAIGAIEEQSQRIRSALEKLEDRIE